MSAAAERALWSRRRGDDWRWSFTTDDDVSGWDADTLLLQVRSGSVETATLIVTSDEAEDVTANATVTADFATGTLSWHIDDAVTSTITPGSYVLEIQVEVDGDVTTVLSHWLEVTPQVAVPEAGS